MTGDWDATLDDLAQRRATAHAMGGADKLARRVDRDARHRGGVRREPPQLQARRVEDVERPRRRAEHEEPRVHREGGGGVGA